MNTEKIYSRFIKIPAKRIICAMRGVRSGSNTYISPRAEISNPNRVTMGSNVVVEKYSRLIANGDSGSITIGDNVYIQPYVLIKANSGKIRIGNGCSVNDGSMLFGHGGLTIGNDVHISPGVVMVPMNHVYKDPNIIISEQGETREGIIIEDDVWVGAKVVILDGVTIGKGSVIGAGAVVTKSVPSYSVAVGSPAKVIKQRK
jgi:acetyltransferase-like isoleucine patch superfamily enzyme